VPDPQPYKISCHMNHPLWDSPKSCFTRDGSAGGGREGGQKLSFLKVFLCTWMTRGSRVFSTLRVFISRFLGFHLAERSLSDIFKLLFSLKRFNLLSTEIKVRRNQYFGSVTFWCGSVPLTNRSGSDPDSAPDSAPDPAIFIKMASKNIFFPSLFFA
jgi:hypothetical protein